MRESTMMYDDAARLDELVRRERLAKVHHQHLGEGRVLVRQFYTGPTDAGIHARMDEERELMRQVGANETRRTKIGRNATCPCGSGRKFKKCCMAGARVINNR